jgi:acetoin utilization deacetylase AcuC-like enzyme
MNRVALITHQACVAHDPGPGHPECPDRLRAVLAGLEHPDFVSLLREQAPEATEAQLQLVHPPAYVEALLSLHPEHGELRALDPDTIVGPGSVAAARRAAGGAIAAVDAIMEGWADTAFAAVRPPGHHAEAAQAMGFCLFSSVAIAARHARTRWGLQRVAVVDFDVHHGNGTQHILEQDPGFLYISSHQYPCYPGTGTALETGAAHNVLNLPLNPGDGSTAFRAAWEHQGLPALRDFAPDILIVSAGFDAHKADPLAQLRLETEDFGWITDQLMAASGGRMVSVLEGGYDLAALAASAAVHVRRLIAGQLTCEKK